MWGWLVIFKKFAVFSFLAWVRFLYSFMHLLACWSSLQIWEMGKLSSKDSKVLCFLLVFCSPWRWFKCSVSYANMNTPSFMFRCPEILTLLKINRRYHRKKTSSKHLLDVSTVLISWNIFAIIYCVLFSPQISYIKNQRLLASRCLCWVIIFVFSCPVACLSVAYSADLAAAPGLTPALSE